MGMRPGGMHGGPRHRMGRSPASSADSGTRFAQGDRRSTRKRFREFLRMKGIFGHKKPPKDAEKKEEAEEGAKKDEAPKPKGRYIRRYIRQFRDQKPRIVLLLFMSVLGVVLRASLPWSSKLIIDFVLPQRDFPFLLAGCALLFVIGMCQVVLNLAQDYTARALTGNFTTGIKRQFMKHLQQLPLARLQELKVGGIISRLQTDTEGMSDLLFNGLLTPLRAALILTVGLGSLFFIAWQVTIICLAFCLVVVTISYTYFSLMRPFQKQLREESATIHGNVTEVFSGIQVVRAFSRERTETRDYTNETHLLWRKNLYAGALSMVLHRSVWSIYWFLNIAIWCAGGYYYMNGRMSLGDLVAFIAFIEWLFQPIFMIMYSLSGLQRSLACAERTFDLLDEPPAMADKDDSVAIRDIEQDICFEDVVFDYPDGTRALRGVDLAIPRGQVTALVGPSGAGKTTITNLAMRFYDVTEGRITVNGRDIRDFRLASYRNLVSLVLQEVFLFDGTVKENITYGKPDATQDEVEQAAHTSHAHEFVSELELGYDTIIGERGVKLSGGQKQRIALARAILTNPQLLILDEATSYLDSESEALVQDALRQIFRNRTTLVIAHRLSTIMDADKISVIERGKIVEEGAHQELLDRQGRYCEMYTKQMEKAERRKAILDWNDEDGPAKPTEETGS